jgi:hypothetical protein
MLRFLVSFIVLSLLSTGSMAQSPERRIALVIGNSGYQNAPELKNPRHDAADVAAALRGLGFEVFEGFDLDKRSMERVVRQFGVKLSGADLAVFFYAGHGIAIGQQNYLVPVDARLAGEGDVDFEVLPLALVLKQMEREAKTSIVLLDACRDNPLTRNLARSMGTRSSSIAPGLAEVKTGVGTLIGFSTQPGNVAIDGTGRNSPYTEALLRHLETPGRDVSGVLIAVRNDVLKATAGRQVPWEHTSLTGQVFLKGELRADSAPSARPFPTNPGHYEREVELSYWDSVKDSKSRPLLQAYLDRYPNGSFTELARTMIKELNPPASTGDDLALVPLDRNLLIRSLQTELQRVGCDPGGVTGEWHPKTRGALTEFARRAKLDLYTEKPSMPALDAVKARKDRICPLTCRAGMVDQDGACVAKAPAAPPAKHKPRANAQRVAPPPGKGKSGVGTCWANTAGRGFEMVPCDDRRAGQKAF